jgi:hypothetical protein
MATSKAKPKGNGPANVPAPDPDDGGASDLDLSPDLPPEARVLLQRAGAEGQEIESGDWMKLETLGAWVCGLVMERKEGGSGKVKDPYIRMKLHDGSVHPFGLGGNLVHQVMGNHVGRILTIMWVNEQDVGKQSPMKVYKVFDHGTTWPSYADKLPF